MKTLVTGAALLLAITLPVSVLAQATRPPSDTDIVAVTYADLDLDQPAGSRLLNNRLRSAAQRVCGDTNLVSTAQRARHWCVRDAMAHGWDQVAANRAMQSAEGQTIVIAALRARPRP
ncbi:UrcA family protein [Brevundimonas sp. NPDC090276]|uniref:UrcA family protein n=1 Tax=Brevundimonas sp. NPDC090276 TaxID=3363956 RepID=UPI00383AF3F8